MNKGFFSIIFLSLSSLLILSPVASATDWSQSNLDMVDKFAIPAYKRLQKNSDILLKSSHDFCAHLDQKHFDTLKESFHLSMDAWQTVQILRSGPAMQEMRFYRLEMWPDRSNAAAKHLRKLQKEANPDSLDAKKFAKASTAIQGLSALERILFAKEIKTNDFQKKGKANFKCHLIETISQNIHTISNHLLTEWQQSYRNTVSKPSKDNINFETDTAVAAQFLNDLNTQLQVVLTQKFKRPLDRKYFRLTRAESWRSKRSLRNISLNIVTSKKLYEIGFASHIKDQKLLKKQQQLFDQAIHLGKSLELPIQVAHKEQPKKLKQWIAAISALHSSINSELPTAIDIPLGFNSLDGD